MYFYHINLPEINTSTQVKSGNMKNKWMNFCTWKTKLRIEKSIQIIIKLLYENEYSSQSPSTNRIHKILFMYAI